MVTAIADDIGSLTARVWTAPKPDAESGRENEDRFWIRGLRPPGGVAYPLHVALADGASDGLYAREWARAVARSFCRTAPLPCAEDGSPDLTALVADASAAWYRRRCCAQAIATEPLPWYLQARAARPTGSTLLGVSITQEGEWVAVAVGDTCLVHLRDETLMTLFPIQSAADFGSAPLLLQPFPASDAGDAKAHDRPRMPPSYTATGQVRPGDSLLLMTDALAAWFCTEVERDRSPWRWLADDIRDGADYRRRVALLRSERGLPGDDTTLIHVQFLAGGAAGSAPFGMEG